MKTHKKKTGKDFQRFRRGTLKFKGAKDITVYHSLHRSGYSLKEVALEWLSQGSKPTARSLVNFINNLNLPGVIAMEKARYREILHRRKVNNQKRLENGQS